MTMKKNIYLFCSAILLLLFSCKNEDQTPDNLKKQMSDKWGFRSSYQFNYTADNKLIDSVRVSSGTSAYVKFRSDGTYAFTRVNTNVVRSGNYDVTSTTTFTMKESAETYNCTVISLNYNSFVFTATPPRVAGQPYSSVKYYLDR
jgi:hypothetical protein